MANGRLSKDYVWSKVLKILNYKHAMGLHNFQTINEHNIDRDLNSTAAKYVNYQLVEQELCLVKDEKLLLPLRAKENKRVLSIAIGNGNKTKFQSELASLGNVNTVAINKSASAAQFAVLSKKYQTMITQ
jgi:beta-glucosidase-like glycosyl hydrolase